MMWMRIAAALAAVPVSAAPAAGQSAAPVAAPPPAAELSVPLAFHSPQLSPDGKRIAATTVRDRVATILADYPAVHKHGPVRLKRRELVMPRARIWNWFADQNGVVRAGWPIPGGSASWEPRSSAMPRCGRRCDPELYRCAISFAGISDVASMLRCDRESFSAPCHFASEITGFR